MCVCQRCCGCVSSVRKTVSYLGESSAEPLTCSGVCSRGEPPCCSVPSVLLSRSNSEVLLSPKSSKCSSSPPMTVTKVGLWLWSSELRVNLSDTYKGIPVIPCATNVFVVGCQIWKPGNDSRTWFIWKSKISKMNLPPATVAIWGSTITCH